MVSLLPNPQQTFWTNNGDTLALGTVATYVPGTLTPKATYTDETGTIANTNPLILDSAGRGTIYGSGNYRFVVSDHLGNLIYDQDTAGTLAESAISDFMLPVVASDTSDTFLTISGTRAFVNSVASAISLMPGPTGTTGPTGPAGPQGPAGSTGTDTLDRQVFHSSGTWTKPASGGLACIQLWGAGGGASDSSTGGGGGGGGYTAVICLLSDLASSVAITIGAGGLFTLGSLIGGNGGNTSFGTYLVQAGGKGGYTQTSDGATYFPVTGPNGYLFSTAALNIVFGSTDPAYFGTLNDAFGNVSVSSPFAGTFGRNSDGVGPYPAIFGGIGGTLSSNGSAPGGGGGVNGGNGGNGQIIVTVF